MRDKDLIKKFCTTKNTDYLNKISDSSKKTLIDYSYTVLFQKYGNS